MKTKKSKGLLIASILVGILTIIGIFGFSFSLFITITGYGIPNYPEFNGEVSGGDIGGSTEGGGNSTT